ncbi:hypothetical protein ASG84_11515 [Rhodococcus sp. Leaf278]|uniref:hypothetical protein n=1 Tax=Rhodococcus sp. Leaf278 TaxID=1736319 RepID=UPI00070F5B28|nr:hypothetical protein [Rhodococcus sp. Leaf278]KQU45918.1 hypothetical protein ASG84_11515 [Rhodococcus sp. Leaf278]
MILRRTATAVAVAALLVSGTASAAAQPNPLPPIFGSSGLDSGSSEPTSPELPSTCPKAIDPANFDPADLEEMTSNLAGFGVRTTGSDAHNNAIDYFERNLDAIPGITTRSDSYDIQRWQPRPASTTGAGRDMTSAGKISVPGPDGTSATLPIAGVVPYSAGTSDAGTTAPLVYLPAGTAITPENSRGRIVVRDVTYPSIPNPLVKALSYYTSPDYPLTGTYDRPFLTSNLYDDPIAAGLAGAAGVVLAWDVPSSQVAGYFDPHEGTQFTVPAVFAGIDEANALKDKASRNEDATITTLVDTDVAPTRNLIATLPGQSTEKVSLITHTDGNTWVQENSSVVMLKLAKYLAALPLECRPRTYEFAFNTAHLSMYAEGTERYTDVLDDEYAAGSVAFAFAFEHMGTREIAPVPRTDGPGRTLQFTGNGEPYSWFAGSESPALSTALVSAVQAHPLDRTGVLRGFDVPQPGRVPSQCSFGGLGTILQSNLVPAMAGISGPWSLWAPTFGRDALDFGRMQQQALIIGDTLLALDDVSTSDIAGAYPAERTARAAGTPTCTDETIPAQAPKPVA